MMNRALAHQHRIERSTAMPNVSVSDLKVGDIIGNGFKVMKIEDQGWPRISIWVRPSFANQTRLWLMDRNESVLVK